MLHNMASLFGKNKLRDIATKLQTSDLEEKIAIVKTWHNDYHKGSLKADKETSREQAYNQDFFIKILGYKEKPAVPYSFEPKATTDKGQLPDAVLSHTDVTKDIKNIAAVVELKGASIELDRPQRREGNMSPIQQGFKYKTQYRNCPFVVVSNFWEFRLYHDNQLDYELWTLDDLVDAEDDYLKFKTFYTLLHSDNLTTPKGASKTEGWLSDIRYEQEEIGKKFYKVYREARLDLLRDIYRHNQAVRSDIDMGIEKAQKIIDRIVFACFAEDRGLLPDNTLQRVIQAADKSAFGGSLWSTFKAFFEAIDVGSEKLEIPDGYNGGLFAHDPTLNALKVSDEPLRKVANISNYNFEEDLSVTILGHIFEQSISDLEEIKSQVEESKNLESIQQSRRKKDGIFYTPDYIVRYIVDNSLGAYLREEEERLKGEFKLKGDITDKNYEKRERQAYGKYQEFLQNVKVVDPACGSGAFLVYVFDFLLAENKRIASILGNNLFGSDNYIKSILKNNIYGVDLNDESVEITKLSLWLKSAEKGKKLTTLDGNIKCGNSLIDDSEVAGEKAFNWKSEFPGIFAKGGFDVVVGNPPYVNSKHIDENDRAYLWKKNIEVLQMDMDLYQVFLYQSTKILLSSGGYIGFITPDSYFTSQSFEKLRLYLIQQLQVVNIVDFPYRFFPFSDVNTETAIIIAKKQTKPNYKIKINIVSKNEVINTELGNHQPKEIDTKSLNSEMVLYVNIDEISQKILATKTAIKFQNKFKLSNRSSLDRRVRWPKSAQGTYERCIFTDSDLIKDNELKSIVKPAILGDGILRYHLHGEKKFTNIIAANGKRINESTLQSLSEPKLVGQRITGQAKYRIVFAFDNTGLIAMPSVNTINSLDDDKIKNLHVLLCIINSKLYNYLYKAIFGESNTNITSDVFEMIPLPDEAFKETASNFTNYVELIQASNIELAKKNTQFQNVIHSEFNILGWTTKLNKWWNLGFTEFTKAVNTKLSLQQKDELIQLYEKYRKECADLEEKISRTEHEIDQLVYKLYGLTEEEISIVEKAS
ncbi:TaqI-like C-terminal specificity domain-containing protein [soil metagenome]